MKLTRRDWVIIFAWPLVVPAYWIGVPFCLAWAFGP
jgi:hypothetical protein